jgi:VWFA-related protein
MKLARTSAALLSAILLVAGARAQERPARSDQPPTFSTEVEMVVVDVVVVAKGGGPLPGLRPQNFTITEDGVPQEIASFEEVDATLPPAAEESVEPKPRISANTGLHAMSARSFVLAFDQDHLSPIGAGRAKTAIADFLRFGPRAGDNVMLVATGGGSWWVARAGAAEEELGALLRRLQGRYTSHTTPDQITDWEALRIWQDRDPIALEQVRRRLETYISGRQRSAEGVPVRGIDRLTEGTKEMVFDDEVRNRAQEVYQMSVVRNRTTLVSLARVLDSMAAVRGRKTLVLFSEGFIRDTRLEEYAAVLRAAQRANVALYFVDVRGLQAPEETTAQFGALLPAADVSEQITQGLVSSEGADELARSTGGFSIKNTNDLQRGLLRVAQEARHYYLLGYASSNPRRDGRWRKIAVKLSGADAEVRARQGYYAPGGDAGAHRAAASWQPGLQQALDSPYEFQGIPLRLTHHVFGETGPGKARTLLTAELDIRGLAFAEQKGRSVDTLEYLLVVVPRDGGDVERQDQKIELQLPPDVRASFGWRWLPVHKEFELRPGSYQARIAVHDKRGGTVGSIRHDFDVPDLRGWRTSTPVLSDTLEPQAPGQPLRPVVPARRTFAEGATLYFQFEVYGSALDPGSGLPRVSSGFALAAGDGSVIARGQPAAIRPTAEGRVARLGVLSLEGKPPGRYDLVLDVHDEVSGRTLEVREPFSIERPAARAAVVPPS